MNIKVQRQKPSRGEGKQGELRLVMTGRGAFLYVKGGNQWHSLSLAPTESISTRDRQKRGTLQRRVVKIANTATAHDGSITNPWNPDMSGEAKDVPH